MRLGLIGLGLFIGHAAAQPAPPASPAQPAAPPTSSTPKAATERREAFGIELVALDTTYAGRQLAEAFHRAAQEKAPAITLLIAPTLPWRSDLVRDALLLIKESRVPVLVFTRRHESRETVSWGAAALGIASASWGDPIGDLSIRIERDDEHRELAPEKTAWSSVEADLRDLLGPHLARRAWLDGAADVFFWPRETWWVLESKSARDHSGHSLTREEPKPAADLAVVKLVSAGVSSAEPFTVRLSHLAGSRGEAPRVPEQVDVFCRKAGVRFFGKSDADISTPLARVRNDVMSMMTRIIASRRLIDEALDAAGRPSLRKEEAAEAARGQENALKDLHLDLEAVEASLADYPEILRTVPPGKTSVASKPSLQPARWRSLVQSERDGAEALRERCRRLIEGTP